jgi:hypothetical protein
MPYSDRVSNYDESCCQYLPLSIESAQNKTRSNTPDDIRRPILIHRSGLNLRRVVGNNLASVLGRRQEKVTGECKFH